MCNMMSLKKLSEMIMMKFDETEKGIHNYLIIISSVKISGHAEVTDFNEQFIANQTVASR